MIKATAQRATGEPLVIFGLTGENVTRLAAGEPILVDLAEFGLPSIHVLLMYGKTSGEIVTQIHEHIGTDKKDHGSQP